MVLTGVSVWAKPADPRLMQRLLEEGRTAEYQEMLSHAAADRQLTQAMLEQRQAISTNGRRLDIGGSNVANLAPKGLVILVEFSDLKMTALTHAAADSMLNSDSYHYMGAQGSARQYFIDQSEGQYQPEFQVVGPIELDSCHDYYGTNQEIYGIRMDRYLADVVIEACLAAEDSVDFSEFDNDGDQVVDFVYIIYAGTGEADSGNSTDIWPCSSALPNLLWYGCTNQTEYTGRNWLNIDGKYIYNFACSNEINASNSARDGLGTFCHEYSHVIGLPDLYDTTYGTNYSKRLTPGSWHLMDAGSYNNDGITPPNYTVWDKFFCGWLKPAKLTEPKDTILLPGENCCFTNAFSLKPTTTSTIYYMENRQQTGWDTYLPGHGLVVWEVNFSSYAWQNNTVNNDKLHYAIYGNTNYPKGGTAFEALSGKSVSYIQEQDSNIVFCFMGGDGSLVDKCEQPYSWTAKAALQEGPVQLGNLTWEVKSANSIFGYGFMGATIGSKDNVSDSISLNLQNTDECIPGTISIRARSKDATLRVSIDGQVLGEKTLTGALVTNTFPNYQQLQGELQVEILNSSETCYIKTIEISYDIPEPEAIQSNLLPSVAEKILRDGQLLLRRGDCYYDITGKKL